MKSLIKIYLFIFFFTLCISGKAQHYQFSQFYAAQTYLNPAFTGANACSRLTMNYRNQWSAIPGGFTTYQVTYDHFVKSINSGIGLQFFNDKAGPGNLKTTQFSALYAYQLQFNKKLAARAGFSAGGVQRSIDYSALVFGDQIARGGAANSVEDVSVIRTTYFDASIGMLFYTSQSWGGFAINHITKPDQSLLTESSKLPGEFKLHGGHKFLLEGDDSQSNKKGAEKNSISVVGNFKIQKKFTQMDIGFYYSKNYFVIGAWYRGIPLQKPYPWYRNNDAIVILVGVSADKINIGYSYDYTVSKLTNISSNGTHEVSLSYQFCNNKKKKKKKSILISCPKF
ncbi:MAG: PorP/SprF family type IX secretion system membrane protein [Bacteroidetes bacterium]|nr:PorP/SprF family type IX secretion system membrane protein [Bacteroidota bacterium]